MERTIMEVSKCPNCGDEPYFIEHIGKWYCYGCNSYIELEAEQQAEQPLESGPVNEAKAAAIAEELAALDREPAIECWNCGAEVRETKDGRPYCYLCETYQDGVPGGPRPEPPRNESQRLLELHAEAVPGPSGTPPSGPRLAPESERGSAKVGEFSRPKPDTGTEVRMCPVCGKPMKFIEKYARHYCYGCRKYAPKDEPTPQASPGLASSVPAKRCPDCGGELKYIDRYSEYYCYTCRKYPLRARGKPSAQEPAPKRSGVLSCPRCGEPLKWIEKYSRYYCYKCKEYAPKGFGGASEDAGEQKLCPVCNDQMKYIYEYNEWYCYRCKRYPLRPSKPVLLF